MAKIIISVDDIVSRKVVKLIAWQPLNVWAPLACDEIIIQGDEIKLIYFC